LAGGLALASSSRSFFTAIPESMKQQPDMGKAKCKELEGEKGKSSQNPNSTLT